MSALAESLLAAQRALPLALTKDANGQIGSRTYRYLTLDKLIEATRPILNEHGLTITQWPTTLAREDGSLVPALTTTLRHTDGEAWSNTIPLYLTDKTMQGLGSAITYGRRYAWSAALGIAADEDDDGASAGLKRDEEVPF